MQAIHVPFASYLLQNIRTDSRTNIQYDEKHARRVGTNEKQGGSQRWQMRFPFVF
jgi:hypothetical protein